MRVHLHGQLAALHDGAVEVVSASAAEAIEAVSRQLDWPRQLLVRALGFNTREALEDPSDAEELHLVPAMFGGGGKFGQIVIGAALIGLSFVPGIGQALQVALLSAGIGMTISGTMALFMKAPSASKSNDPDPSKYLGVNQNTTAIGTKICNAWGRVRLRPHFLSINADASDLVTGVFPATPT